MDCGVFDYGAFRLEEHGETDLKPLGKILFHAASGIMSQETSTMKNFSEIRSHLSKAEGQSQIVFELERAFAAAGDYIRCLSSEKIRACVSAAIPHLHPTVGEAFVGCFAELGDARQKELQTLWKAQDATKFSVTVIAPATNKQN